MPRGKYRDLVNIPEIPCEALRAKLAQMLCPGMPKLLNAESRIFLAQSAEDAVRCTVDDARAACCAGINLDYRFVGDELQMMAERS